MMDVVRVLPWLFVAVALAGCAGGDEVPPATDDGPGAKAATELRQDPLTFASDTFHASETFTGSFAFEDNDQFAGEAHEATGGDGTVYTHDITTLLPTTGLFELHVTADADPAGGDIDVWFIDDGTIDHWQCDCPFGGHNELVAYALGDGGSVQVAIQYDEISTGPDDPDIAFEGFDYTLDVTVRAEPTLVAPGRPVAITLDEPGEELHFSEHTAPVTVYGPDDAQLAVLEPADTVFRAEDNVTGEFVFIQRLDGSPYQVTAVHEEPEPHEGRILDLESGFDLLESGPGESARLEFEAPPTVLEIGGCGFAGEATVSPAFRILDPAGEPWAEEDDGDISFLGWGTCYSNWLGSPDQMPGTWAIEMEETVGEGTTVYYWTTSYVR